MTSNAKRNAEKIVEKVCRNTKLLCIVGKRKRMLQEFGRWREVKRRRTRAALHCEMHPES